MSKPHSAATSIHMGAYVQTVDPGAVGAKKLWVDTSGGEPYLLKVRNTANLAWEDIGAGGGGVGIAIGGNTEGEDLHLGTLDDFDVLIIRNGVSRFSVAATGTNFAGKLTADELELYGPVTTSDAFYVDGIQVLGPQGASVADVANADAPTAAGSYTQADIQDMVDVINELKAQVNALLARVRAHGIIVT